MGKQPPISHATLLTLGRVLARFIEDEQFAWVRGDDELVLDGYVEVKPEERDAIAKVKERLG